MCRISTMMNVFRLVTTLDMKYSSAVQTVQSGRNMSGTKRSHSCRVPTLVQILSLCLLVLLLVVGVPQRTKITETKLSSFWWNFRHWIHRKLTKCVANDENLISISVSVINWMVRDEPRRLLVLHDLVPRGTDPRAGTDSKTATSYWVAREHMDFVFHGIYITFIHEHNNCIKINRTSG